MFENGEFIYLQKNSRKLAQSFGKGDKDLYDDCLSLKLYEVCYFSFPLLRKMKNCFPGETALIALRKLA